MRRSLVGILVVCAALTAGCGSAAPEVRTYSEGDSEISARSGDRFRVELDAHPGVGDDWSLVGEPDASVLRLVDSGFESEGDDDVVGTPGTLYFVFEATGPGSADLVFRYCYRGCGGEGEELEHEERFAVTVS